MTARIAWTYEDYAALPNDGKRYEAATDRRTKRDVYARHDVPHYWIVDLAARVLESYVLRGSGYELAVRASGPTPVDVPPFVGLDLVADSLWPPFPILP